MTDPALTRIDVHAHFPVDVSATPSEQAAPWTTWHTPTAIRRLDRLGIRTQILSFPVLPTSPPGDAGRGVHTARTINDTFASIIADEPERFGAFATLPADDPDSTLAELTRALDELHLDGIGLCSNTGGRYLGDPFFEPVLAEAERRHIPIFVHPALNPQATALTLGRPPFLVEFPFDTTRSIIDAIYTGVFQRHPDLRVIAAHCGGALPALAWRITHLAPLAQGHLTNSPTPHHVSQALKSLYLDTALSGSAALLHSAIEMVGINHLLYGTDCGAANDQIIIDNTNGLHAAGLTPSDLYTIEHDASNNLFQRLHR